MSEAARSTLQDLTGRDEDSSTYTMLGRRWTFERIERGNPASPKVCVVNAGEVRTRMLQSGNFRVYEPDAPDVAEDDEIPPAPIEGGRTDADPAPVEQDWEAFEAEWSKLTFEEFVGHNEDADGKPATKARARIYRPKPGHPPVIVRDGKDGRFVGGYVYHHRDVFNHLAPKDVLRRAVQRWNKLHKARGMKPAAWPRKDH